MSELFDKLVPYMEKGIAYDTALTLFQWDQETQAPLEADEYTSKIVGELSDSYMQVLVNDKVKKILEKISTEKEMEKLTLKEKGIIKEWKKICQELEDIPREEYKAYSALTAKAGSVWARAKEKKDFSMFAPVLEELITFKKKFIHYRKKNRKEEKDKRPYDILLETFEPGFGMEQLDVFFEKIKEDLVPFLKEVEEKCKDVDKSYNEQTFPVDKQQTFCKWLAGYVGFDFNKGVIQESAHPFTTNLHNHDVRITNHFYENNLESAIFSVIHESGHALYEMGVDEDYTQTLLGGGTSMGMHESQSRFFENVIGRSEAFWKPVYPKLVETYPQELQNISLQQFVLGINKVKPGLIRTEADELSYTLHILVRYEIEKMIFEDQIKVEDLEEIWADKYEEYLGVRPENAAEGVLQDIHWACGDFGYFPSYAIGTAVAAQMYYYLKENMPLEEYLLQGNLTPIREYLREHVHKFGKMKNTNEILKDMTGENFDVEYYIRYLKEKYQKLYW